MKKRLFAGLLALAMMLTVIPVTEIHAETVSGNQIMQTVSGNSVEQEVTCAELGCTDVHVIGCDLYKPVVVDAENGDETGKQDTDEGIALADVEIDTEKVYVAQIGNDKYESLQAAINKVKKDQTIVLTSNVTENVALQEKVGLYYTINGQKFDVKGTFTIETLSDINDNRRITIKDINFVTDTGCDFITSVNKNHYPRLTVEGCSFTGTGKDNADTVAIRLKSAHSVEIKNCTGTGLHSFLQNTAGWNITIEDVTVTESKGGFAMGTVQGATVIDCNITSQTYGIRFDAGYNNNATVENCTITGFIPVVVRNITVDSNYTFIGTNTMTASNIDGYWFVAGVKEYEENGNLPEISTAKIIVKLTDTSLDEAAVYGQSNKFVARIGTETYESLADALSVATNGTKIKLLADTKAGYKLAITNDPYDYTNGLAYDVVLNVKGDEISVGQIELETGLQSGNAGNIVLNIEGGAFEGIVDLEKGATPVVGNIIGGTFGTNPSEYVASGYDAVASDSNYVIGKHELKVVAGTSATCTATGVKAHYKCDFCGKIYSDAAGVTDKTLEELTIPALGHKMTKTAAVAATYANGHMVIETTHFSEDVIVYEEVADAEETETVVEEEATVEEAPVEEVQEEAGLPIVPIIIVVLVVIVAVVFFLTKKKNDAE